ncbi:MAG: polysaccharide deacetylase family protein [Chloroflexota bacterium]|nr:polysaccharide deacetylase family protein [Chloroflexota bacterium]
MTVVPILIYHSISRDPAAWIRPFAVTPEAFGRQLDVLVEQGATTLTVSAFVDALARRPPALPERPVLITFDDGFADFYDHALPALVRRRLAATLYVATGFVGRRIGGGKTSGERMLDWSQLADVREAGVEIGGHSHSHAQLDAIPSSRAAAELARCKSLLEEGLGIRIASFAYPHGYSSPRVRRLVVETGYRSACAVKNAFSSTTDDRYSLARLTVRATTAPTQIAAWLAGEGAPPAPVREPVGTRAWRLYRRAWVALGLRPAVDLRP